MWHPAVSVAAYKVTAKEHNQSYTNLYFILITTANKCTL